MRDLIRPARPDEASSLSALALRSKAHWGYDEAFLEACREELTIRAEDLAPRRVTVLERDGALGGFYGLENAGPDGELWWLFVDPPAIGTGAGRLLFEHAVATARDLGWRTMRIESDPGAEAFYRAMGARRTGETPSQSIPGRSLPLLEFDLSR